jgi:hypothetical protein
VREREGEEERRGERRRGGAKGMVVKREQRE